MEDKNKHMNERQDRGANTGSGRSDRSDTTQGQQSGTPGAGRDDGGMERTERGDS